MCPGGSLITMQHFFLSQPSHSHTPSTQTLLATVIQNGSTKEDGKGFSAESVTPQGRGKRNNTTAVKTQHNKVQTGGNCTFTRGQTISWGEFKSALCLIYLELSWGGQINSTLFHFSSITRIHKKAAQVHYSRRLQGRSGNSYIWEGKK